MNKKRPLKNVSGHEIVIGWMDRESTSNESKLCTYLSVQIN